MATYVVDTHALAWYLGNAPQLSEQAGQLLDGCIAGDHIVIISPIVVAELLMMAEKRRTPLVVATIIARLQQIPSFHFVAIDTQTVLSIQPLAILPDIHDRLIVATALEHNATLITHDQSITQSQLVKTVW